MHVKELFFFIFSFFLITTSVHAAVTNTPKISIPEGFDFNSVVVNHFESKDKFLSFYKLDKIEKANEANPYGLALANLTLGLIKEDLAAIANARSLFSITNKTSGNIREKELSLLGIKYTENLLAKGFNETSDEKVNFERINIERQKPPVKDFKKIIIGKTSINIKKGYKIKTQVNRVTRDWLSAYNVSSPPWQLNRDKIVPWHEGKKIREILDFVDVDVSVVWGTKAKKIDGKWYAPDAEGIYRFKLSENKVYNYPTGLIVDSQTVYINDTHGINDLAWDSTEADLVVGCGDLDGKVEAAYYLASKGVNVYMPTDRFNSMLIGVKTKGTIIGSAPVRNSSDGAIIGNQPILIAINEPIMVTNTTGGYPLQYYDAPYLYFKELERYIGKKLKIMPINITEYGKADKLVMRAKRSGVKVIGIRVASKEEYDAVSWFLRTNASHRAVLFHSAVYPEGYRLFFEFPKQTTFGDINVGFE